MTRRIADQWPTIRAWMFGLAVAVLTSSTEQILFGDQPSGDDDSTASLEYPLQPNQIPDWYFEKPKRTDEGILLVAKTGPFDNFADADDALNDSIRETVCRYLSDYSGTRLSALDLPDDLIEQWVVADRRKCRRFSEELAEKYGVSQDQYFAFAQVLVNDETVRPFFEQSMERQIRSRLKISGLMGTGLLGLIGIGWCYLKVDKATRGFHSRTLRRMAILVSLMLITGLLVLYRFL